MRVEPRYVHLLFLAYVAGVVVLMFAPVPASAPSLPGFDKFVHVGVFLLFGALLYWDRSETSRADATSVILMTSAAAGLVELIQIVLPYRSGSMLDFVAGVLGGVVGALAMRQLLRMPTL
jgi:VanZ family protein